VPQTSMDLVKDPGRRWGNEFAKRPDMPSLIGGPWLSSGPKSPPNPQAAAPTSRQEQK
jgi:hypothetical protein